MADRFGYVFRSFGERHNYELITSALILLRNVSFIDHETNIELDAIVRKLNELSGTIVNSRLSTAPAKIVT